MKRLSTVLSAAAATALLGVPAQADYHSHPETYPDVRCVDADGNRFDPESVDPVANAGKEFNTPAGVDPIHCQKLIWDLPITLPSQVPLSDDEVILRVGAPYHEDAVPRFPRGVTDRVPPRYAYDPDRDGKPNDCAFAGDPECGDTIADGFEFIPEGADPADFVPLCGEHEIPYWKELLEEDGSARIGTDDLGFSAVEDPDAPHEGPLFQLACHRGSRAYLGPWQSGIDTADFDRLTREQWMRFENTDRLDDDGDQNRLADVNGDGTPDRVEWNVFSEYYNHFASHHATCYYPNVSTCNDATNPEPREAYQPGGACIEGYQEFAEGPSDPNDPSTAGACYSRDVDVSCNGAPGNGAFRNATQVPGRLSVGIPAGRGQPEVEDQIWRCNHHTVLQLPPGSYSMERKADYRLQRGGLVNPFDKEIYGTNQGEVFGGTIGEIIIQYFTVAYLDEDGSTSRKPINTMFNAVPDLATTIYPPFTWNYHTSLWTPPYDAYVATMAIHSHHRMVKGTMDILPANPVRLNSPTVECGGSKNGTPTNLYVNWEWEDARVCEFWKEEDGPVIVRKGEQIATTCFVNNGVTPEAIKHGLVASTAVEGLKALGAPIPDYPELMPASTWGDILTESPVGDQLLYGTHPPINYRVVYKCAPNGLGSSLATNVPLMGTDVCDPNPNFDADGDYIDGPYINDTQCGGNYCEPSNIIFRCVGEDEMCIGVALYYPLPRIGNMDDTDQVVENLTSGDPNQMQEVGTPGATQNTDIVGYCADCPTGAGL